MKVLEPGKAKEKWTIQHRCTGWGSHYEGCGALLEVEWGDLRYRAGCYDEKCDSNPSVCFKCPCCNKITYLGLNDWPTGYHELKKWSTEWQEAKPEAA